MKIGYLIGIGIGVIVIAGSMISINQYYIDSSEEKIRIAFFPSIVHAVPIVGIENGIFEENLSQKIDVKIFDSGPQVIESLFSNSIDIAYVGPGPVINGYLKSDGEALKILAGAADGGASFVAQKDSGLDSIENFDGKRIAAPQISNTQDVSLRHYLSTNGLQPVEKGGTVYVLNISNPDIYTLFAKGDIDGAWVPEPWATMLVQDLDGVRIFNESQFWPDKQFSSVLLIGRTDYVENNPDISLEDLLKVFPGKYHGTYPIIKKVEEIPEKGRVRYFMKDKDRIDLLDSKIAVCNQWGITNIDTFIKVCKTIGLEIT